MQDGSTSRVSDFRPAGPGQTIVYEYQDGASDRHALQGWVLIGGGWLPAYWDRNRLAWTAASLPGEAHRLVQTRIESAR
ncbi:hypothetical protein [Cryptosporangium sp. NPDC048952]|uniref:hypothetical protein n=1 Tax=Cryptosporangium sp. NPDC048952 TaxID=3363961 RepID=UPI00371C2558